MENKTGIITNIETRKSKNGKSYWLVHIDKLNYNIFDKELMNGISIGDVVDYKTELNDRGFNQLLDMKKSENSQIKREKEVSDKISNHVFPNTSPSLKSEFHLTIEQTRSNALECALKSVVHHKDLEEVIKCAKRYEKYILTGE